MDNIDLIEYTMCVLTGKEGTGDCIIKKIQNQGLDIQLNYDPSPPAVASVWDPASGLELGAVAGALAVLSGAGLFGVIAYAITAFLAESTDFDTIVVYVESEYMQSAFDRWANGDFEDRLCACMWLAGQLLHEIGHTCLRELLDIFGDDAVFVGKCAFLDVLQNSFGFLAIQRYTSGIPVPAKDIEYSPACEKFFSGGWMNDDRDRLE